MRKLLIVDDEPLIQIGIKSMLDWASYGIELCGTALNGQQALELMDKHQPDIVITDIKMPIMDGLTLAKTAKERYGDIPVFIVLTSHEEFQLVKEAIQYGIIDYLVKIELTPDTLLAAIEKAKTLLTKMQPHVATVPTAPTPSFQEKFFIFLLHNLFQDEIQFKSSCEKLGLCFDSSGYAVAFCSLQTGGVSLSEEAHYTLYSSTLHMLEEMLGKYLPVHIVSLDLKSFSILFCLEEEMVDTYQTKLTHTLENTFQMIHNYFNVHLQASISRIVKHPLAIAEAYKDARQIHPQLSSSCPLLFFEEVEAEFSAVSNTFHMGLFKEDIKKAFSEADQDALATVFTEIISLFRQHPTKYLQCIDAACNILYLTLSLLPNGEEVVGEIFMEYPEGYRSIYHQNSLEQVLHWLEVLQTGLCNVLQAQQKNYKHRTVAQVKKYIDEHLEERLTLLDVATAFSITPNYLSLLFKKHSDVGFSEYIAQQKIAYAKELMTTSHLKIYEIADKLGFESAFYFSKVFKKVEGCSPRDFRQYE